MTKIPQKYPYGYTDEEIENLINGLSDTITGSGFNINTVMQLNPQIQLGQNELEKRFIKRSARLSKTLAIIAISIAVVSSIFSAGAIWFSYKDMQSDKVWQKEQLQILSEINLKSNSHTTVTTEQ